MFHKRYGNYLRRSKSPKKYKQFDITEEAVTVKWMDQCGACAICQLHEKQLPRKLALDHNHTTNQIRGLLCHKCNSGLGFFNDNPKLLRAAITYLGYWKCLASPQ